METTTLADDISWAYYMDGPFQRDLDAFLRSDKVTRIKSSDPKDKQQEIAKQNNLALGVFLQGQKLIIKDDAAPTLIELKAAIKRRREIRLEPEEELAVQYWWNQFTYSTVDRVLNPLEWLKTPGKAPTPADASAPTTAPFDQYLAHYPDPTSSKYGPEGSFEQDTYWKDVLGHQTKFLQATLPQSVTMYHKLAEGESARPGESPDAHGYVMRKYDNPISPSRMQDVLPTFLANTLSSNPTLPAPWIRVYDQILTTVHHAQRTCAVSNQLTQVTSTGVVSLQLSDEATSPRYEPVTMTVYGLNTSGAPVREQVANIAGPGIVSTSQSFSKVFGVVLEPGSAAASPGSVLPGTATITSGSSTLSILTFTTDYHRLGAGDAALVRAGVAEVEFMVVDESPTIKSPNFSGDVLVWGSYSGSTQSEVLTLSQGQDASLVKSYDLITGMFAADAAVDSKLTLYSGNRNAGKNYILGRNNEGAERTDSPELSVQNGSSGTSQLVSLHNSSGGAIQLANVRWDGGVSPVRWRVAGSEASRVQGAVECFTAAITRTQPVTRQPYTGAFVTAYLTLGKTTLGGLGFSEIYGDVTMDCQGRASDPSTKPKDPSWWEKNWYYFIIATGAVFAAGVGLFVTHRIAMRNAHIERRAREGQVEMRQLVRDDLRALRNRMDEARTFLRERVLEAPGVDDLDPADWELFVRTRLSHADFGELLISIQTEYRGARENIAFFENREADFAFRAPDLSVTQLRRIQTDYRAARARFDQTIDQLRDMARAKGREMDEAFDDLLPEE